MGWTGACGRVGVNVCLAGHWLRLVFSTFFRANCFIEAYNLPFVKFGNHSKEDNSTCFVHFVFDRYTDCVCQPQDIYAMIFQLSPRHITLRGCVVFPHGHDIIEKVNLSVLSYVICVSADWNSGYKCLWLAWWYTHSCIFVSKGHF